MVRLQVCYIIVLLSTCLLFACNRNGVAGSEIDRRKLATDSIFSQLKKQPGLYKHWQKIYQHKDSSFSIDSFFYVSEYNSDFIYTLAKLHRDYYRKYGRLFIYKQDSSKFIDAFSNYLVIRTDKHGKISRIKTEAEQEVAVIDVRSKKRYRVFYCGSPCFVAYACWVNDDAIALLGETTDEDDRTYVPTIWLVNIKKSATAEYNYNHPIPDITPSVLLDSVLQSQDIYE